jgi:DNA adenine methylase
MHLQPQLFSSESRLVIPQFKTQLLKWVGNKQRFAHEIASYFPFGFQRYFEPFLGSGAVLGTLAPAEGIGSDAFEPLVEIWQTLKQSPQTLKDWYAERWHLVKDLGKKNGYEQVKQSYNSNPNGADLLFLCRACYGGVVRFRKSDGYMSTPCGVHDPIQPTSFSNRVDIWRQRVSGCTFLLGNYESIMDMAQPGDLIYCDPPYTHSQGILYRGQSFQFTHLLEVIARCKARGISVALSIDGTKKSGAVICDLPIPDSLFEREIFVNCGRSMLRRFQMGGQSLESELVSDRLLLTY